MLPEEKARIKIDKQLNNAGWDIVSRQDYVPNYTMAIKEALMQGGNESDYLLFIDNKAIAVVEAKREENDLGDEVELQAENYAVTPENWYGTWFDNLIPLVYLANGKKILFKNLLTDPDGDYIEIKEMHSPKRMLQLINQKSEYGALPRIEKKGLRDCQFTAEDNFEKSIKQGKNLLLFLPQVQVKHISLVWLRIVCLITRQQDECYSLQTEITSPVKLKLNLNCLIAQKNNKH